MLRSGRREAISRSPKSWPARSKMWFTVRGKSIIDPRILASRTKSLPAESRASYHQSRKGSRLPPLGRAPRSAREAAANQLTALVDSQPELPQDAAELLERLLQPEQPRHPWHLGANDP